MSRHAFREGTSVVDLERATKSGVSRRQFLVRSAGALGGVAALASFEAPLAFAGRRADPVPIPGGLLIGSDGGFTPVPSDPTVHVLPPAVGFDMSTITDFNGVVAGAQVRGTATGSDHSSWTFDADMRFMEGLYRGTDGFVRHGSFGFV